MTYQYYLKIGKTLSGIAFHSFSVPLWIYPSLEKPVHLGNFYHTINLKAKTSVMKKNVRRAWETDNIITVWEE
jgi:hypothetical protein